MKYAADCRSEEKLEQDSSFFFFYLFHIYSLFTFILQILSYLLSRNERAYLRTSLFSHSLFISYPLAVSVSKVWLLLFLPLPDAAVRLPVCVCGTSKTN